MGAVLSPSMDDVRARARADCEHGRLHRSWYRRFLEERQLAGWQQVLAWVEDKDNLTYDESLSQERRTPRRTLEERKWGSSLHLAGVAYALASALAPDEAHTCKVVLGTEGGDPSKLYAWFQHSGHMYLLRPQADVNIAGLKVHFSCDEWMEEGIGLVRGYHGKIQLHSSAETRQALVRKEAQRWDASLSEHINKAGDFYELFGLDRYADVTDATRQRLMKERRRLLLKWHPDKNPEDRKALCEVLTAKINLGREVLLTPDLKRRYDDEMRKNDGTYLTWKWWCRWGHGLAAVLGGLAMVIAGATAVTLTSGSCLVLTIGGSACLGSGIAGIAKVWTDPNCSDAEYLKVVLVNAAAGAAATSVGMAAAGPVAAYSGLAWLGWAAGGAAGCLTSHMIKDASDLIVTEGLKGTAFEPYITEYITDAKDWKQVWSKENLVQLGLGCLIGAGFGGGLRALVHCPHGSAKAQQGLYWIIKHFGSKTGWQQLLDAVIRTDGASSTGWQRMLIDSAQAAVCWHRPDEPHFQPLQMADIPEMVRGCRLTLKPSAADDLWLRKFLHGKRLNSFEKAIRWVAKHITYNKHCSGMYLRPCQVIQRRQGVCMEFATLAYTLASLLDPERDCKVVIGLAASEDADSLHAWIQYGDAMYEPQSGEAVVSGVRSDERNSRGYRKTYSPIILKYDEVDCEIPDPAAYRSRMGTDAAGTDAASPLALDLEPVRGLLTTGFSDAEEWQPKDFAGIWEDEQRGFRILSDGTVLAEWSKVRDVDLFKTTRGAVDPDEGPLAFTLSFPPDKSNPSGRAHWQLFLSGKAVVSFDESTGIQPIEQSMTFRKPMVGIWRDDERILRVFEDGNVVFMKAQRDIRSLNVPSPGYWDEEEGTFNFTVEFPPDESNPDGRAHWHLHEGGFVCISFDSEMPKGHGRELPCVPMTFNAVQ